jgi:hypothetical protein
MAMQERWEMVEQMPLEPCLLELRARVEALEAAQNLRQQDESAECAAPPNPMDSDLLQHFQEARGDSVDRLRSVYELGRQHGGAASSAPAPAPTDGLVRMVAKLLANEISERKAGPGTDVTPIARAAILEVVAFMRKNDLSYCAYRLEQEVE